MNHHPFSFHLAVALRSVVSVVAVACAIAAPSLAEAQIVDPPAEPRVSVLPESGTGKLLGTGAPAVALSDGAGTGEVSSTTAECAETATIEWGGREITGTLYLSPCVQVDIKLVSCSWCGCGYMAEIPGGGVYTFHDYSEGGGLECGLAFPISFH